MSSMDITLGVRPEHVSFVKDDSETSVKGTVDVSEMMGSEVYLHVNASGKDVVLRVPTTDLPEEYRGGINYGTAVNFTFPSDLIHLFNPETEENLLALEKVNPA